MIGHRRTESSQHCSRDLWRHLERDGPEKESVDHANPDQTPGIVPGGRVTALGDEMFQVVGEEVSLGPPPVVVPEGGGDVVADVEIPGSALDQLPIDQSRTRRSVEIQIADMGVAMQ